MKKLLIGLVAAGVLLIAAVLIAPSFIDWNAHKKQIAALVHDATGRELSIRGNIDITILPSPALRVEDVRLASIPGAVSPEMIRLPEARISVAFGSLFEGRLAVIVTMVRPTVNLEKLQDGRVNWDFAADDQPGETGSPDESDTAASGMPLDVKLDSFRIENGSISYHDAATGTVERVEKLNSEVSFDSLNGPFRIDGTATVRGIPLALKVSTGNMKPDTPLSTIVDLSVPGTDSTMRLNGTLAGLDGEPTLQGEIELKSQSLAVLMAKAFAIDVPRVLAQPLLAEGSLSASKESVALSAIDIELGSARATGDVKADIGDTPRVAVSLRSGNLNLDTFLDGAAAAEAPPRGGAAQDGKTSADAPAGPQMKTEPGGDFVLPAIEVAFIASADIVQYNGALVRDLSAKAALRDGRILVEDISAVMPGSTILGLKGTVGTADGKPDMDFGLSGRSDNLREMLEWVGVDTATIPADRMRRFSITAAITGAPRNFTAKDISVQLDASKLSGGLALVLRDRPAFGLRLVVDRVNVDGYLPGRDSPIGAPPAVSMPAGSDEKPADSEPDGVPGLADALAFLEKFDANIDATVKNFIIARTPASDLHLDFTVLNGGLEVRQAGIGDLAGLRGNLKGTLDRTKAQPVVTADYAVEIVDAARFARFIDSPALLAHRS
ncbi:MAG: AsmA family protein, partial [Gammaproteobacteria bacterium]